MNIRIQFELPEDKVKDLEKLMKEADINTRKDLFNNALTLLEWAIKEKKTGRIIASIDEQKHRYKELIMPALAAVVSNSNSFSLEDVVKEEVSAAGVA